MPLPDPLALLRWLWSRAADLLFGPDEPLEYQGTTTPEEDEQ